VTIYAAGPRGPHHISLNKFLHVETNGPLITAAIIGSLHRGGITMSATIRESSLGLAAGTLLVLSLGLAGPAWGLPAADRSKGPATVQEQTLTVLQVMRGRIESGRFDQALELLGQLRLDAVDAEIRLQAHHMIGYVYQRQGEHAQALHHYRQMLGLSPAMPDGLHAQTRYTAAQLSFALGDFAQTVEHLKAWEELGRSQGAGPYILLGQAYFKVQDFPRAIRSLETGVGRAEQAGEAVREHWLKLLHHLYSEQDQWRDAEAVLQRLTALYPKPEYENLLEAARARRG
jgi:tetratricopeptide (TPR) repeat protein